INVHLYDGINRFTIRSHGKNQINDNNWLLKADILAPTNLEIISSEYQAKNSTSQENWDIDQWLVSDRPIPVEECSYLYRDGWGEEPPIDEVEEDLQELGFYDLSVMMPFEGELLNFTVPTEYGVNVTEWAGFVRNIPNEYGYTNYLDEGVNNTDVEDGDQIIYYTNIHFLQNFTETQLEINHFGEIEAIYWDSQYVYGDLGGVRHEPYSASAVSTTQGANNTETITIDLWDWYEFRFWKTASHGPWASIYPDFEPATGGLHKLMIIVNGDVNGTTDHLDINASLNRVDDTVNVLTGITEYIVTKQAQQEKDPKIQIDNRTVPNGGRMGPNSKWAGKKITECTFRYDGIRYHSSRIIYVGVEDWGQYEDLNGDQQIDEEDAMGMLTTMVVEDAGTKHESSAVVQQAIGMNADNYSESQPTQLCIPYTMVGQNILNGLLFSTTNTRLSYSSYNSSFNDFELVLEFNQNDLTSTRFFIDNSTYKTQILNLFNNFVSTSETITMRFSLNGPVILEKGNETLIIDLDRVYMIVEEFGVNFDRNLQRLNIAYADKRNLEEITVQLKSRFMMHLDPLGVHMSYKKIGSRNIGFIVYNIDKIIAIADGKIAVPSQIKLGLFSGISNFFKRVKDSFATVVDAIQESMKAVNARMHEFLQKIGGAIHEAIYKVVDGIMVLVGYIVDGVKVLIDKIVTVVKGIVEVIKNIATRVGQGIANLFEKIFKTAQKAWQHLKNAINNMLEKCKTFILRAKQFLKKIFDIIGKGLSWIFKSISGLIIDILLKDEFGTSDGSKGNTKSSMTNSVRLLEETGDGTNAWNTLLYANPLADFTRIMTLFSFAFFYGTNVGCFETKDIKSSITQMDIFDEETEKYYPHVLQLDHVFDVIAGRQNLAGESNFDLTDTESWPNRLNPGQGENATYEEIADLIEESGIMYDKFGPDIFSRGQWIRCINDDGELDWYFGLRRRVQFGFGKRYFEIPFISEFYLIMAFEAFIGMVPMLNILQDLKDVALDPYPLFKTLAAIMIPFDVMEAFSDPEAIGWKILHRTLKVQQKSIVKILDVTTVIMKRIKGALKWVLGGPTGKILGLFWIVGIGSVNVLVRTFLPSIAMIVRNVSIALALLGGLVVLIASIGRKMKVLKYAVQNMGEAAAVEHYKYMNAFNKGLRSLRASAAELGEKSTKKNLRTLIKEFIITRLRTFFGFESSKKFDLTPIPCRLDIDPCVKIIFKNPKLIAYFETLFDTQNSKKWLDLLLLDKNSLESASDEVVNAAELITTSLYGVNAETFFDLADSNPKLLKLWQEYAVVDMWSVFEPKKSSHYSKAFLYNRLAFIKEVGDVDDKLKINEIITNMKLENPKYNDLARLFDLSDEADEFMTKFFGFYQRSMNDIREIIEKDLDKTIKTRLDALNPTEHPIEDYKMILGWSDELDRGLTRSRQKSDKTGYVLGEAETYASWMMITAGFPCYTQKGIQVSTFRGAIHWEVFQKAYQKIHFDPEYHPSVKQLNILKQNPNLKDVKVAYSFAYHQTLEGTNPNDIMRPNIGPDDIAIFRIVDKTTDNKHYIAFIDEYKGTSTGFKGLKREPIYTKKCGFDLKETEDEIIRNYEIVLKQESDRLRKAGRIIEWSDELKRDIWYKSDSCYKKALYFSNQGVGIQGILNYNSNSGTNKLYMMFYHAIFEDNKIIELPKYANEAEYIEQFVKPLTKKHFKAWVYENQLYDLGYRKMTYVVEVLDNGYVRILSEPQDFNKAYLKNSITITFQSGPGDANPKQIEILHELLTPQVNEKGFLSFIEDWDKLKQTYEEWVKEIFEDIWNCEEMKKL
ncbi:MAG: phage tail protein, partial [Candidatus Heimdallarchaeaceae archaeon]